MTQDELTLLLLTLTPAEILKHYPTPARADLVLINLVERYPDLYTEKLLRAAYPATRSSEARDARLVYCVEKVRDAIPSGALCGPIVLPPVTSSNVAIYFEGLERQLSGGHWHGVTVTLNAFESRLCGQDGVTTMSVPILVATADCLAELRRLDAPNRTDRAERYKQDLVEIFTAWCAV
jgi:hypothetical protein